MKRKSKGFTLIELLIVVAIIGLLMALIAPAIASTRGKSQIAVCINNIRQITMAAFMYADDHNSVIPDVNQTASYVQDTTNIYKCPRDTKPDRTGIRWSYTAFAGTPKSLLPADIEGNLSETMLFIESEKAGKDGIPKEDITALDIAYWHSNRTVIAFADGHIFNCNEGQVASLLGMVHDP